MRALHVVLALGFAAAASAESVHYKGKPAQPSFQDKGLALAASGELAGLGNGDLVVTLNATGNPTVACVNPAGETQPPGAQPKAVQATGTQPIPAAQVKNGTVAFSVSTAAPTTPVPGAPDCPNKQWTEPIQDVAFTGGTLTVTQAGKVVLSSTLTFKAPTANGAVAPASVSVK